MGLFYGRNRCMLKAMRRTELELDEQTWEMLERRALRDKTTVSSLVSRAVSEKYGIDREQREADMEASIGIWKDRTDLPDSETYVRNLRQGTRLKRLGIA